MGLVEGSIATEPEVGGGEERGGRLKGTQLNPRLPRIVRRSARVVSPTHGAQRDKICVGAFLLSALPSRNERTLQIP